MSNLSHENVLRHVHSEADASLITNGFLVGKVGRKIEFVYGTTTVANDTIDISFIEDGSLLYTLQLIFTDGGRTDLISAERTA
jgi:hypothetical protein